MILVDIGLYCLAAFFEIFGCFSFWMVFKLEKSYGWLGLGVVSLMMFAWVLTRVDSDFAGRAYAIYGGIYIAASLLWLLKVEKMSLSVWDMVGVSVSIIGALIIIIGNIKNY